MLIAASLPTHLLLGTTTVITIAGHNGAKSVWEQKTR